MSQTKSILITGATAGIGRHAAIHLASRGHHVIATGRREDALEALREDGASLSGRLDVVRLDVNDGTSIETAKAQVQALLAGGGLDALVNNAGYAQGAPLVELTDEDLRNQFETNVFGLMAVTRAFLPDMMARRSGRVVNVSSIAGRLTFPMMGAYHASKYAVEALSDALRMEMAPWGVGVSLIEPGPIQTNFVARMNQEADAYRERTSPYTPVFERAKTIEARAMAMAPGPEVISRAITKAIVARRPRARYVAPLSAHLSMRLMFLMPVRLRDWLMRAVFGLDRRVLESGNEPALQAV